MTRFGFINDYERKSMEDANHYKHMMEAHRIYKILARLNVEFDEVLGWIIGRTPLPPLNEVFAEVHHEENRTHVMLGNKTSIGKVKSLALITDPTANTATNFQQKSEYKPQVWCDYCSKLCHTRETCWKPHGKPTNWKYKSGDLNNRGNFTANEANMNLFTKD